MFTQVSKGVFVNMETIEVFRKQGENEIVFFSMDTDSACWNEIETTPGVWTAKYKDEEARDEKMRRLHDAVVLP